MSRVFCITFTWFCFYFNVNSQIRRPKLLIHLGRLNRHQCILENPIEKSWSLYVQLIARFPIRCPRSLIRLKQNQSSSRQFWLSIENPYRSLITDPHDVSDSSLLNLICRLNLNFYFEL